MPAARSNTSDGDGRGECNEIAYTNQRIDHALEIRDLEIRESMAAFEGGFAARS
jgi:hypothetical protein